MKIVKRARNHQHVENSLLTNHDNGPIHTWNKAGEKSAPVWRPTPETSLRAKQQLLKIALGGL